jgi:hypothetical protein
MKARILFLFAIVLACELMLGSCSPSKYVAKPNEEIFGTWTNEKMSAQKLIIAADGGKLYLKVTDETPYSESTGAWISKWTDSEGNIWYKSFNSRIKGPYSGFKFTELDKLSKSGTVLESVFKAPSNDEELKNPQYPTKIDPQDSSYTIYFKAK